MPLEFGDDEGVAFADGGEGLIEARAGAVGAGEPVVKVDALLRDAELAGSVALGGEVLVVGGAAGVADQGLGHGRECTFSPRQSGFSPYGVSATPQVKVTVACSSRRRVSGGGSTCGRLRETLGLAPMRMVSVLIALEVRPSTLVTG